jgi:hypothetical protein
MIKILLLGGEYMSNYITDETAMNNEDKSNCGSSEGNTFKDYDDEPYSDDNVLVRSLKRRSFLISSSNF